MEKYGVVEGKIAEDKVAGERANCPRCGECLEDGSGIRKCPKCGTEPFENGRDEDV